MLKLIRKGNKISFKMETLRFFEPVFLRFLLVSFAIHLGLFGFVRMRMTQISDDIKPTIPIEVAIDQSFKSSENKVDVISPLHTNIPFQAFFSEPNYVDLWLEKEKAMQVPIMHLYDLYNTNEPFFYIVGQSQEKFDDYAVDFSVNEEKKLFPIKIDTTGALRDLTIIEDGSKLFRSENPNASRAVFLKPYEQSIDYDVVVKGKSGKISSFTRKKELLDKNLLSLSDAILKEMRFIKNKRAIVTGSVTITFLCHSDDMKKLLIDPFRYYQE